MKIQELYKIYLKHPAISTDTRNVVENSLFFALRGEKFNGNEFAAEALGKGSVFAIVDDAVGTKDDRFILVDDVVKTLQELATYHLKQIEVPVIAITGTNGKTTTKELVTAVLSKKFNVHSTKGNLNNHIGVPLTALSIEVDTEFAVIELGANHVGEIEQLSKIAQPSFGVITNIGKAHLEGFGSLNGVIKAKNELYEYIAGGDGILFVNGSDEQLMNLSTGVTRVLYGRENTNDCVCKVEELNPYVTVNWKSPGSDEDTAHLISSQLFGEYNFDNIAAAICIGNYFGVSPPDIAAAIEDYLPTNNRSQIIETNSNRIVLDAYNANPMNMKAALESFQQMFGENKMLILGDMLELGGHTEEEHRTIINQIKEQAFDNVVLVGEHFEKVKDAIPCNHFQTTEQAAEYFAETPVAGALILIKGSRGVGLELLVEAL